MGLLSRPLIQVLLIFSLGLLAYSNTFQSPFQWDESEYIVKNRIVKDLRCFTDPSRAARFRLYAAFERRYVGFLTFALNYRLHGTDVVGYHIVNIVIHLSNAALVYLFSLLTFRTPFLRGSPAKAYERTVPLLTALLFVAHPVQTEAVTYIFQRLASLVTMFYLLSMVLYAKGRLAGQSYGVRDREPGSGGWRAEDASPERGNGSPQSFGGRSAFFYVGALVSTVLAMKTKENAFTLPVAIALYEVLFFDGPAKKRVLRLVPFFLAMPIIPISLFLTAKPAAETLRNAEELAQHAITRTSYLFTQFRVIITYIRLLFLPVNQDLDYDYPVFDSFFNSQVAPSFFALLCLLCLGLYLLYRSRIQNPGLRIVGFGILWFFITLSIESSIVPIPMVICEYRAYLPSAGFFFAAVTALFCAADRLKLSGPNLGRPVMFILFFLVFLLAWKTYERNILWQDSVTLWEDTMRKSPGKARVYFTLATVYDDNGAYEKAIRLYQRAIEINPDYADAYNNLGTTYDEIGQYDRAVEAYQKALVHRPYDDEVFNNLGAAYVNKGEYEKAIGAYKKAEKINPDSDNVHYNLGLAYSEIGLTDRAIKEYGRAAELDPESGDSLYNRGLLYAALGDGKNAAADFRQSCALGVRDACGRLGSLERGR